MTKENKPQKIEKKEVVEKSKTTIEPKKILIVVIVVLVIILGIFYINKWNKVKEQEKLMKSYLMTSGTINLEIKNLDEVSYYKTEAPSSYFVLINYTGNKDNYELEKGLKSIIDTYKLNDEFYYLNVESIMDEDNYLTRLNTAFDTDIIKTVPIILYYKDGEIVDTVKRLDSKTINPADFQKLLDIYDF